MIANIKNLWGAMTKENKKKALKFVMDEFGLKSKVATKKNLIYNGEITEERQPIILKGFQEIIKAQLQEQEKELLA